MELEKQCNVYVNESFDAAGEKFGDQVKTEGKVVHEKKVDDKIESEDGKISYAETLMHLFKGNVGSGCFAMADAVKNGGLVLAPILTLFLGIFCVHAQHILLKCSLKMQLQNKLDAKPDYAETVELCFASSNNKKYKLLAPTMKAVCNIFICVTQLGFCCIYLLFVGTNLKQVLDFYGFSLSLTTLVMLILIPIWLSSLITNLKLLAPCSAIANVCMITGLVICYYYSVQDLPPISERHYITPDFHRLPLFFGTAIFAFEGIALVLPLQNAMRKPQQFSKLYGVLNVGMVLVIAIYISFGAIGYWKYGEATEGSLTLNLPTDEILAQSVKLLIALGILLGYAIQFFVAIQIMIPLVTKSSSITTRNPFATEIAFRTLMVLLTLLIAKLVPNLSLLLSLIGAVCGTVLALVFPPVLEFIISSNEEKGISWSTIIINCIILFISLLGFLTGGYESLTAIIKTYSN